MTSTSVPFGSDFANKMIGMILNAADEGAKQAARVLWSALLSFLSQHWLAAMLFLFLAFIIATAKAMMGRWGTLGSFLYNFFYLGTLFVIGLIWGPEVFLGDFFKAACAVILYPVCYLAAGIIMDKMGVHSLGS